MVVMVVGANGQLGSRVCRQLLEVGQVVRGSVRTHQRGEDLRAAGGDVVVADLASPEGLRPALDGVSTVVLTANPVAPRRGDDPRATHAGMSRLVDDSVRAGVRRFVLPSVPAGPVDAKVPPIAARRALEHHLLAADIEAAVLRFPPFMEVWLALVGSSVPLRGETHATVARPSGFLRAFRAATATLVERNGLMLVPGATSRRHAFIAMCDVVTAVVNVTVTDRVPPAPVEIGGPEVLTWEQVAKTYSDVLGRRVRTLATPALVYGAAAKVLAPMSPVAAATMALNLFMAASDTPWEPGLRGVLDADQMTTVREFLTQKVALTPAGRTAP
jgi:uncharacterized protein YbjT (DUF2867 family)